MDKTQLIQNTLMDIGVKPSLKGYNYLVYAIYNYHAYDCKMEALYLKMSKIYNATRGSIERAIRHCIENCVDRTMTHTTWTKYFSNTIDADRGKPTNKEFIACIVQYINTKEAK